MPQTRLTPTDADLIMKLYEVRYSNSEIRRMLGRPAMVMLHFDGRMIIRYEGRDLAYREILE